MSIPKGQGASVTREHFKAVRIFMGSDPSSCKFKGPEAKRDAGTWAPAPTLRSREAHQDLGL